MDYNRKRKRISALSWVVLVLWLVMIFIFSAQPATQSDGLSKGFTRFIIESLNRWALLGSETSTIVSLVEEINHIVRKFAHGGSYFILGILSVNAFIRTGLNKTKVYALSAVFCILYAISDEFHQLYVPGRSGQLTDVLIDSIGAASSILILWAIGAISRMRTMKGKTQERKNKKRTA